MVLFNFCYFGLLDLWDWNLKPALPPLSFILYPLSLIPHPFSQFQLLIITLTVMSKPTSPRTQENPSPIKKSAIINFLLSDTSISKATYNKTRADRMIKIAKSKESTLSTQKEVRVVAERCRQVQEVWEKCVKLELTRVLHKKKEAEVSALKIQKIVRGFLVRIKIDSILLSQREARSSAIIHELRKQTDFCMLTLGSNTVPVLSN